MNYNLCLKTKRLQMNQIAGLDYRKLSGCKHFQLFNLKKNNRWKPINKKIKCVTAKTLNSTIKLVDTVLVPTFEVLVFFTDLTYKIT